MKISIPVMPDVKKGLLYFLIVGIIFGNFSSVKSYSDAEGAAYVLAAGMGISVVWAIYEKMSKHNLKAKADKLEQEVNSYKSDENIKEYLIKSADFSVPWENFLAEANQCMGDKSNQESELCEDIISCIYRQIKKYNLSTDEFHRRINKGIIDLTNHGNELSIKSQAWELKPLFLNNATKLIERTEIVLRDLKRYNNFFEAHKDYIKLLLFLDKGIEEEYAQEIEYAHSEIANWDHMIDQIIKSKSNQVLFPYLFYAQDLKLKLDELSRYLNNVSHVKAYPFQEKKIARATYVHDALQSILQFISASNILAQEKDAKVEYDRKERYIQTEIAERKELLRLETKERESKIAQQNSIAEAKLTEQRNRERQIVNEKARIEKEKRELEFKSKENALQLARIHEGQGIKNALADNNNKWRADYDNLNAKHQRLTHDNQQHDVELNKLRAKVSKLESDIKGTHSNSAELERYARSLELRISNLVRALDSLAIKVNNPPFNPQIADGLPQYINNLRQQVQQLKTIIS